jgi:hypothetical protein
MTAASASLDCSIRTAFYRLTTAHAASGVRTASGMAAASTSFKSLGRHRYGGRTTFYRLATAHAASGVRAASGMAAASASFERSFRSNSYGGRTTRYSYFTATSTTRARATALSSRFNRRRSGASLNNFAATRTTRARARATALSASLKRSVRRYRSRTTRYSYFAATRTTRAGARATALSATLYGDRRRITATHFARLARLASLSATFYRRRSGCCTT